MQVNSGSNEKAVQVESMRVDRWLTSRCRERTGRQQIDGIPDAVPAQESVAAGEHRHRHAAGQSAFDACRNRIDFQRQPGAVQLRDRHLIAVHFVAGGDDRHLLRDQPALTSCASWGNTSRNQPTHACHGENRAQDADRDAGDQSGEQQGDAESEDKGPRGGRGQSRPCVGSRGVRSDLRLLAMFAASFSVQSM